MRQHPRFSFALCISLLVGLGASITWLLFGFHILVSHERSAYLWVLGIAWLVFILAVLVLRMLPRQHVPVLVLLGTLLIGATGLLYAPTTSTDTARYNWDGIVQKAGIDPYRYVPADPALTDLRPTWLFHPPVTDAYGSYTCHGENFKLLVYNGEVTCTSINRPTVPTIYPPVAEALFTLTRLPFGNTVSYLPTQLLGLLMVLGVTALLLRILAVTGRRAWWAALWGWCPFVTLEAVNNAHIDAAGVLFTVAGVYLLTRAKWWRGSILYALGVATKVLPLLLLPTLIRRRPLRLMMGLVGTITLCYLPHVLAVGPAVIGYLPGYLQEEGYDDGSRAALLSVLIPGSLTTVVALGLLAVIAVVTLWRVNPASPWRYQLYLVGGYLLLFSPRYSWYALLLVPFVVLTGRIEWGALVLVLALRQIGLKPVDFQWALLVALLVILAGEFWRWHAARNQTSMLPVHQQYTPSQLPPHPEPPSVTRQGKSSSANTIPGQGIPK